MDFLNGYTSSRQFIAGKIFKMFNDDMHKIILLIKLIYLIQISRLFRKSTIYLIFSYILIAIIIYQTMLVNMFFPYFLHKTTNMLSYTGLIYFFSFIFLLWIIVPIVFGFKLSPDIDYIIIRYLPVSRLNFALVNMLYGYTGIGPISVIIMIYILLAEINITGFQNFLLITFILLIFFNISASLSYFISHRLQKTMPRLKTAKTGFYFLFVLVTIFLLINHINISFYTIIKFLPPGLAASGLDIIIFNNNHHLLEFISGLLLYTILANYLFIVSLSRRDVYQSAKISGRLKIRSRYSYFMMLVNVITQFIIRNKIILKLFVAKEIYYYTTNIRLVITYLLSIFTGSYFLLILIRDIDHPFWMIIMIFCFVSAINMGLYINLFAFEFSAIYNYFIFPLPGRFVLLSKNIANIIISAVIFLIISIYLLYNIEIQISIVQFLILLVLYFFSNIFVQSLGNILSIYFPMRVPFSQWTGMFNPFSSIVLASVLTLFALIPSAIYYIFKINDYYFLVLSLVLLGIVLKLYTSTLSYSIKKLYSNRMLVFKEII
jgi:hypothetical protein